jgi:hypothetical protein
MKKIIILSTILFFISLQTTSAHQPRIPEGNNIVVTNPEISKAYYTQLKGTPHTYTISSEKAFSLYVNILVPDIIGQKQDITAIIIKDNDIKNPFAVLNGNTFKWTPFFEPF